MVTASIPHVVRAFAVRAPFRDALMAVAGAGPVAGEWKISGVPAFEPADGRFAGYRGVALREVPPPPTTAEAMPDVLTDPDSLRELVHEIKTPLNAIIGFGEIIEGQYLGPADRGYRERAGEIVRQARLLLTAIDDLDFAAKVHSARGGPGERADLGALVDRAASELREVAARHGIDADVVRSRGPIAAAVEPELADRLLLRLFSALADRAETGERLRVSAEQASDGMRISVSRPAALRSAGGCRAVRRQGRTRWRLFIAPCARACPHRRRGPGREPRQHRVAISPPLMLPALAARDPFVYLGRTGEGL